MSPRLKRRLRILLAVLVLLALSVPVAWLSAPGLLVADSGVRPAQAVVVLGGEPWTRPQRAAEVFQECHASLVIASGNGDCEEVRRQLEARAVPASVILTECKSTSTFENAEYSVALLREHGVKQAVIVTSWFHSRRALACFRKAAPGIEFTSRPTAKPAAKSWWPDRYERSRLSLEYAKLIYYWVRYGVTPFEWAGGN